MTPRDILHQLVTTGETILKDPLKNTMSPSDIVYHGSLKTDIFMAKLALERNSIPMIDRYIDKLKLYTGGQNAATQEENN